MSEAAPPSPEMSPQQIASDPRTSAFVTANAGSGKTSTLVNRVARLLLDGSDPGEVLCVTYTKAAAAEMQRRLFETLGGWSTADDAQLRRELDKIGEGRRDLGRARTLFARALETPGGLKIQTLHAFCEKLLRRFPLEAGIGPAFKVLEDAAAAEVSRMARDEVAYLAWNDPEGAVGAAYAHLAVALDLGAFEALLSAFEGRRHDIGAYVEACRGRGEDVATHVWRTCGFDGEPANPDAIEREATDACAWSRWREAAAALAATGMTSDAKFAQKLTSLVDCAARGEGRFADCLAAFSTTKGEKTKTLGTKALHPDQLEFLYAEQERLHDACARARAARVAVDTVHALTLAVAYAGVYEGEKAARGALDFDDLTRRTVELLTRTSDATWVLYKLDGGIAHVLVDEAQDTAPEQWAIVEALTGEFFAGHGLKGGASRTVFAVGDEKQSIYSFQGAAPERFLQETQHYSARADAAGAAFVGPSLLESWRSTPQVLAFVDAVFASPALRAAVPAPAGSDVVRHVVGGPRRAHAGQIDLWPLFQETPKDEPDAWTAPVDARPDEGARKRLARRIAQWIGDACARGEAVHDKTLDGGRGGWRAMRPGDVLILVRRRDGLFEEILRALKKAGLPTAGADRLKLSGHVAFQDLKALVRFALYPWDDLTLAALLRSPLCEVDEAALYALAHGREGASLWSRLNARSAERPAFKAAADLLGWARESRALGPFDFLGRALSRLDAEGRTLRQRLLTRLGPEAEDAVEELLAFALAAEARGVGDLERFAAELERADVEIKRELEAAGGLVRVMTVHGAKGLESPVVILPDTTGKPNVGRSALLKTEHGGFLFAASAREDAPASADARAWRKAKTEEEALRLLYVALTRARDRVIVAGRIAARDKGAADGTWYAQVAEAFDHADIAPQVRTVAEGEMTVTRFGPDPAFALTAPPDDADLAPAPAWLRGLAPAPSEASAYASPSAFADRNRGPAPSPLAAAGGIGRFRRGELIHRLLQLLPDVPPDARESGAARLLDKERDLSIEQKREMASAALGVLNDPRFALVFGPHSRAEAAVAGGAADLPPHLKVSGRVDRMVVTPERVLVVDFKTNRPSPDRIEQADPAYIAQMAIYVAVLRAVFPDRKVEAALVWTDGPKLMPVPENVIASKLVELKRLR